MKSKNVRRKEALARRLVDVARYRAARTTRAKLALATRDVAALRARLQASGVSQ